VKLRCGCVNSLIHCEEVEKGEGRREVKAGQLWSGEAHLSRAFVISFSQKEKKEKKIQNAPEGCEDQEYNKCESWVKRSEERERESDFPKKRSKKSNQIRWRQLHAALQRGGEEWKGGWGSGDQMIIVGETFRRGAGGAGGGGKLEEKSRRKPPCLFPFPRPNKTQKCPNLRGVKWVWFFSEWDGRFN